MSGGDITIVAGGWSVRNIAIDRLVGTVIAVNEAAIYLPNWHGAVSMDRLWAEYRFRQLAHITLNSHRQVWLRRSAVQNIIAPETLPGCHIFDCDHTSSEFSILSGWLNGTNSGACALNLAWQRQPQRLFLLGFDMNRDRHGRAYWHDPYPWAPAGATSPRKYSTWAGQFDSAARAFEEIGCQVFNVSPSSAIESFQKMTPVQYARLCS